MINLHSAINKIKESGLVVSHEPATLLDVRMAEKELGVVFPKVYVEYLLTYGYVDIYDRGVFGLGPSTADHPSHNVRSVVFKTGIARHWSHLPSRLIAIWNESHEEWWCLESDPEQRDGPTPVLLYDPGPELKIVANQKISVVSASFEEWLCLMTEQQVAWKRKVEELFPGKYSPMGELLDTPRKRRKKKPKPGNKESTNPAKAQKKTKTTKKPKSP